MPDPHVAVARALRLSRLPGLTLAEAAARAGVSLAALRRARKAEVSSTFPSREDLLLAALTRNGADAEGTVGNLAPLASWLDYVNKDGTTADEVAAMLAGLASNGTLELDGDRWRLRVEWP